MNKKHKKYEYQIVPIYNAVDGYTLNAEGEHGWRLVNINYFNTPSTSYIGEMIFYREVPPVEPPMFKVAPDGIHLIRIP